MHAEPTSIQQKRGLVPPHSLPQTGTNHTADWEAGLAISVTAGENDGRFAGPGAVGDVKSGADRDGDVAAPWSAVSAATLATPSMVVFDDSHMPGASNVTLHAAKDAQGLQSVDTNRGWGDGSGGPGEGAEEARKEAGRTKVLLATLQHAHTDLV